MSTIYAERVPRAPLSSPALALDDLDATTVPIVPEDILTRHLAFVPNDTRFRAGMRLQQSLWRHAHDLAPGSFVDETGRRRRVGSMLTRNGGQDGANWLDPRLELLVRHELAYRERGAAIDVNRLRRNLLSSQPLCFNVLGPAKLDLTLATKVFNHLLPGMFGEILAIHFETSPGRGRPQFTSDYTAFDATVRGTSPTGQRIIAAFEFKFTESMSEPAPERFSDRIAEIVLRAEVFRDVDLAPLWRPPFQQLLREVALAQSMLDSDLADDIQLFVVAPAENHHVRLAVHGFADFLAGPRPGGVRFGHIALEDFVDAFTAAGARSYSGLLRARYLDLQRVEHALFAHPSSSIPRTQLSLPGPTS